MPILVLTTVLHFQKFEEIFLYMIVASGLYLIFMLWFDYLIYKDYIKEGFERNFNRIEIDELMKETNKNKEEVVALTEKFNILSREKELLNIEYETLKKLKETAEENVTEHESGEKKEEGEENN
jgi:hypothetical protein